MTITVTLAQLKSLDACLGEAQRFAELFGDSVTVTRELCVNHAGDFDWQWAARNLLSNTQRDVYYAQRKRLWDAYYAQVKALWDAYCAQLKPLDDAYIAQAKPLADSYYAEVANAFYDALMMSNNK